MIFKKNKHILYCLILLVLISTISFSYLGEKYKKPQICFSPDGKCINLLLSHINKAKKEIKIAAFTFTCYKVASALIHKHRNGVKITIIGDKKQSEYKKAQYRRLEKAGIKIYYPIINGIQHNKYMIIDNKVLITGSYNYSYSANHFNLENLMATTNPYLLKEYNENWLNMRNLLHYIGNNN